MFGIKSLIKKEYSYHESLKNTFSELGSLGRV